MYSYFRVQNELQMNISYISISAQNTEQKSHNFPRKKWVMLCIVSEQLRNVRSFIETVYNSDEKLNNVSFVCSRI